MNPQPYQLSFLRLRRHQGIAPPHIFPNRLSNIEVRSCSGLCTFTNTSRYLVLGLPSAIGLA